MFTEKGRRSLDRIFEGLQEIKVPAYLTTRSGRKEVRDILNKLRDAREDEKKDLQAQLNYICSEYKVDIGLLAVSEERFLQSFPDKNDVILYACQPVIAWSFSVFLQFIKDFIKRDGECDRS